MREIIITAKMQNGRKLTPAELEFLKSRCGHGMADAPPRVQASG